MEWILTTLYFTGGENLLCTEIYRTVCNFIFHTITQRGIKRVNECKFSYFIHISFSLLLHRTAPGKIRIVLSVLLPKTIFLNEGVNHAWCMIINISSWLIILEHSYSFHCPHHVCKSFPLLLASIFLPCSVNCVFKAYGGFVIALSKKEFIIHNITPYSKFIIE